MKTKCPLCGGEIVKETESQIAEFVCADCDCLMDISDKTIYIESDAKFYMTNYGTDENIEIFTDYKTAKKNSRDGIVYCATLSSSCVWYEHDLGWNYEDNIDLFQETPYLVEK